MSILKKLNKLPKNSSVLMALELAVIYASLQGAMPAALAVYPQVTYDRILLKYRYSRAYT
jgi:hypothetical protein